MQAHRRRQMHIDTQIATGRGDRPPLKRADVEHHLQEVGSPKKLELMRENLQGVDLSHFTLSEANLRAAILRGAKLHEADLRAADLRDAILRGAKLRAADLRSADLSGAYLHVADLR